LENGLCSILAEFFQCLPIGIKILDEPSSEEEGVGGIFVFSGSEL
jgi:hypothetical protein